MNKLLPDSINWARQSLVRDSDTDLFPRPVEIDVVEREWTDLSSHLCGIDVTNHKWSSPRYVLVPKDATSFRRACQLDPIDGILYSAIVREIGPSIEARRPPVSAETCFSYRFAPTADGRFYPNTLAWEQFWARSKALAVTHPYVAVTDVADFYNQIYHHVIIQQLQAAGVGGKDITAIDRMLNATTQTVSRGLPVGPHATHLLAEMSLLPMDELLALRGRPYCRYVDDIHIFCQSADDAQVAIFELADGLDRSQKVMLNREKTKVYTAAEFLARANTMIAHTPINAAEEQLLRIIQTKTSDPYARIRMSELSPEDLKAFSKENIERVLSSYLDQPEPNFIRLRWFLRRLAQPGAPAGVEYVVANLARLLPAVAEVTEYLNSAKDNYKGSWRDIGTTLLKALDVPLVNANEFLQIVVLGLFSRISDLNHLSELIAIYGRSGAMARRKVVLAAAQAKADAWLRQFKYEFGTSDPWLRRAFMYASRTFPKDERDHWLRHVRKDATELERAVINDSMKA